MHRCGPTLGMLLIVALANTAPGRSVGAQALDSTGMPPLEQLAQEAGRASRRSPIRTVARAFLCDPTHPLVDSASVAACAALDSTRSVAITAAFARGLEVPIAATADTSAAPDLAICPDDLEHANGPRVLLARVTAPVVGVREGRWEGRLTVELRCRSPGAGGGTRTMAKGYLYQWTGHAWQLYQFAWWRAER